MSTEPQREGQQPAVEDDESSLETPPEGGDEPARGEEPEVPDEGSSLERPESEDPLDRAEIEIDPARVRRAPRFGRFALAGGLVGIVLGFVIAPFARFDNLGIPWHFDPFGLALVMAAILLPIGILVACGIALLADRRSRRGVR